mgnify:CR=1 FL=1
MILCMLIPVEYDDLIVSCRYASVLVHLEDYYVIQSIEIQQYLSTILVLLSYDEDHQSIRTDVEYKLFKSKLTFSCSCLFSSLMILKVHSFFNKEHTNNNSNIVSQCCTWPSMIPPILLPCTT